MSSAHSYRSLRALSLLMVVLFLLFLFGRGFFEQVLHVFERPFVAVGTWISQKIPFLEPQRFDIKRVETLEDQVMDFALDQVQLEQLKQENAALKATLGFLERQDVRSVMASIISRSRDMQRFLFSIDRGRNDGIHVGDPVIVKDGVLVGKVITVTSKSATIVSLTDPSVATAVGVLNQTQTIGVAQGMAGNLLRLKFIPQNTALSVNDLVVSSGLESSIPSGLLIGLVNDVQPESNAPFLEAVIEPLVDVRRLTSVHVLLQTPL